MSASLLYMHPRARKAWDAACKQANLRPVVTQTQGNAKASAGYHASDGTYRTESGTVQSYCAAVDVSVNQMAVRLSDGKKIRMDEAHVKWFLHCLAQNGFVAWYRYKGSFKDNKHIHGVYCGVPMKPQLRGQVKDFLNDRTGLAGHGVETFWTADSATDAKLRALFEKYN